MRGRRPRLHQKHILCYCLCCFGSLLYSRFFPFLLLFTNAEIYIAFNSMPTLCLLQYTSMPRSHPSFILYFTSSIDLNLNCSSQNAQPTIVSSVYVIVWTIRWSHFLVHGKTNLPLKTKSLFINNCHLLGWLTNIIIKLVA